MGGEQPANSPVENQSDVSGTIVPQGVRQGREADEIREKEGVLRQDSLIPDSDTGRYLLQIPIGMSRAGG
jgi:hypothetical protein